MKDIISEGSLNIGKSKQTWLNTRLSLQWPFVLIAVKKW